MVVAAALLAGLLVITPWMVGAMYDDGTYLVLAKSLASGRGYRYLNLPGAPEATHFPPGYPVFLAIFLRLAPDFATGVAATKFANAALLSVVALGVYALCRRAIGWPAWPAAAVALVGVTAPALLSMNAALMSETLFLAVLFPTLLCAERLVREAAGVRFAAAVGVLIGLLQLIRSIGLPLLGAVLLLLMIRRRWRDAAVVAGASIAVVAPWLLWVARHAGTLSPALAANYGSYREWIQQTTQARGWHFFGQVVGHNLPLHAMYIGDRFMPVDGELPSKTAFICFLIAAAAGVAALYRRVPVTLLFLAGYVALVLSWPFPPDRFYYPLEPLVAMLVAGAMSMAWRRGSAEFRSGRQRAAGILLASAVAVLCVGHVRETIESVRGRRWELHQRLVHVAMVPVIRWVSANTPHNAVVGTDVDPLVYLYAGRRTVPLANFRAEYHLRPASLGSPGVTRDTRDLLTWSRPGFAVVRAAAPAIRSALATTLPSLPVVPTIAGMLPDGGVVLRLRWSPVPNGGSR
ncbi:MAG: hypothetical protein ACYC1S_11635 [Gemmatimonadaceae bacterium]